MRLGDLDALKNTVIDNFDNLQAYFPKDFIEEIDNAPTVEITEKQAILLLINSGWLVNHDKELRERWERPQGEEQRCRKAVRNE